MSCIRTRSPSRAPPENGELGSTASTPTLRSRARYADTSAAVVVDFPTPGEPVRPIESAEPVYGASSSITARSCGLSLSTRETSRATARPLPARACSNSSPGSAFRLTTGRSEDRGRSGRRDVDEERVALTAAAAQGRGAHAATATAQLEREMQGEAGTGHADRVTQGDRAAVDVHHVRVQGELAGRREPYCRKGFVDLDQIQRGGLDALLGAGGPDRGGGLGLQRRVRPGDHAVGADLGQPGEPELLGLRLAHDDHRGGTVGDLRGRAG